MHSKKQLATLIISVVTLIAMMVVMNQSLSENPSPVLAGAEFLVS